MGDSITAQSFLTKTDRSFTERLVALLLTPLMLIYWIVISIRKAMYRIRLLKSVRLPVMVISVGGITIGGSGKTPVVIYLANYLTSIGKNVIVLTRGYGGESDKTTILKPGDDLAGRRLSDEVMLMSKRTSAVIGVGSDRVAAFGKASDSSAVDVAILDDGFQHLRIRRDLDIVVLDASAPFGNKYMLPSGNLREPKSSLKRCDAVLFTRVSQHGNRSDLSDSLPAASADRPTVMSDYVLEGIEDVHSGETVDPRNLIGVTIFAFSAIANPDSFFSILEREGFNLQGRRAFRDHHIYTETDLEGLVREALSLRCQAFMVTEKDAVKVSGLKRPEIPVYAYRIRLQITRGEDSLRSAIARRLDDQA